MFSASGQNGTFVSSHNVCGSSVCPGQVCHMVWRPALTARPSHPKTRLRREAKPKGSTMNIKFMLLPALLFIVGCASSGEKDIAYLPFKLPNGGNLVIEQLQDCVKNHEDGCRDQRCQQAAQEFQRAFTDPEGRSRQATAMDVERTRNAQLGRRINDESDFEHAMHLRLMDQLRMPPGTDPVMSLFERRVEMLNRLNNQGNAQQGNAQGLNNPNQ